MVSFKALKRLRVLILDGDWRQTLPYIRSLRRAGHHVTVVSSSRLTPGYLSRYPNRRLIWPPCNTQPEAFFDTLLSNVKKYRYDVTFALEHHSVQLLSPRKDDLSPYTILPLPNHQKYCKLADKAWTMSYCLRNGIPCPKTFFPDEEDLESIIRRAPFPIVVKPRHGVGAIGLHHFNTPEQLRRYFPMLQAEYGSMLIQECIPFKGGIQFRADTFCDSNGKMHFCLVVAKPRFVPLSGGTSTVVYTIDRDDIQEYSRRLLEGIGWTGPADVDYILDPRNNTPKLLESDPRPSVGVKIVFDCGIDLADLHLRLALGEQLPPVTKPKTGMVLRNLFTEILWYYLSDQDARKNTFPPFFKFFGRGIFYQTIRLDDPLPAFGYVATSLIRYSSRLSRDEKFGYELNPR